MPNLDLDNKGEYVVVPEEFKKFFKEDKLTYTNLTTKKNRLENNPNISDEEKKLLSWINQKLTKEIQKIDGPKRARMNIEAEGTKTGKDGKNNYKKREATKVQKVGSVVKVYESEMEQEIDTIKYLIEYMNNNKNKI